MRIALPTRALSLALPATLLLLMLPAPAASAHTNIGEKIIIRCTHGESLSGFTQKQYDQALKELETSSEEYTNCANLIHRAQLAAASSRGGSGAGGGGSSGAGPTGAVAPATPVERKELNRAPHAGSAPQQVGNEVIRPGVVHVDIASAFSSLPTPLLAVVAFLLACALALSGRTLGTRVRKHRHG